MTTHVPQIIDLRYKFSRQYNVDFAADAKVLVVSGLTRLIWRKATTVPVCGIRGFGRKPLPVELEIRFFKEATGWNDNKKRICYDTSKTLLEGGRLTKNRLMTVADKIDSVFGAGTTEQIIIGQTLLLTEDKVGVP